VVASFCFVGSYVILRILNFFMPLRAQPQAEAAGLDRAEFGEAAYDPGGPVSSVPPDGLGPG
jgi:ammonia channel protein AmtB